MTVRAVIAKVQLISLRTKMNRMIVILVTGYVMRCPLMTIFFRFAALAMKLRPFLVLGRLDGTIV